MAVPSLSSLEKISPKCLSQGLSAWDFGRGCVVGTEEGQSVK